MVKARAKLKTLCTRMNGDCLEVELKAVSKQGFAEVRERESRLVVTFPSCQVLPGLNADEALAGLTVPAQQPPLWQAGPAIPASIAKTS